MNKTILTDVNGWTPIIDSIVQECGLITAAVFGRIWRYCQGEKGVCYASLETISIDLGIDRSTVQRHARKLVEHGYLVDLTPDVIKAPHTYADTGKAGLKASITVAQRNKSVADDNSPVADSNSENQSVAQDNKSVAQSRTKIQVRDKSLKTQKKIAAVAAAAGAAGRLRKSTPPTHSAEPDRQPQEELDLLHAAGVYEPTATEIAGYPWVDCAYLTAHIIQARLEHISAGLLVTRLRNNDPPPLTPEQQDELNRLRYVDDEFAEFVEH